MILHAIVADSKTKDTDDRIIIKIPDTYLVEPAVNYFPKMKPVSEFMIEIGRVTRTIGSFVRVHEICKSLWASFCTILPVVHALTVAILPQHYLEKGVNLYLKLFKI